MWMSSDGEVLTGLWFEGSKDTGKHLRNGTEQLLPVFKSTICWLDVYFSGNAPDFTPEYRIENMTDFRGEVQHIMQEIPYGKTITYGDIAREMEREIGRKMSAQAVGGAVGSNPISILIPCHRVVGSGGKLTGYAGGLEKKIWLLQHEGWEGVKKHDHQ